MGTPEGTNKNWVTRYTICYCPCSCPCILLVLNLRAYKLHFYYSNDYEIVFIFIFCIYNDFVWMWNASFSSLSKNCWQNAKNMTLFLFMTWRDCCQRYTEKNALYFFLSQFIQCTIAKPVKCVCDFPQRKIQLESKSEVGTQKARTVLFISLEVIKSLSCRNVEMTWQQIAIASLSIDAFNWPLCDFTAAHFDFLIKW